MNKSRLTFVKFARFQDFTTKRGYITRVPYNLYRCSCGTLKEIRQAHVKRGKTLSCGCLNRELAAERMRTELAQYRVSGGNEGNRKGGGGRKGQKAPNKGKVFLRENPPGEKYVTRERADAIYWGMDGEVSSLRQKGGAANKGKKLVDGKYE
tara:strand:+ start:707 stop:1162 length:456 start_codon:yes stop_codon:yes gene_type:complete